MNKGLEAFDELMSVYFDNEVVKRKYGITEETAKEKRKTIEKELKILDIAKEKIFPLLEFTFVATPEYKTNHYTVYSNPNSSWDSDMYLTQEEFDLLKEVLS